MKKTTYFISGPLGVGKSSISKEIAKKIENGVVIEGDVFFLALEDVESISWEQRLALSLKNILSTCKNYLNSNLNVVIDFASEEKPTWLAKQLSEHNITIKYVVLTADENTLSNRLEKRGDSQYLLRSITLLNTMKNQAENKQYLLDVTNMTIPEVAEKIIHGKEFIL